MSDPVLIWILDDENPNHESEEFDPSDYNILEEHDLLEDEGDLTEQCDHGIESTCLFKSRGTNPDSETRHRKAEHKKVHSRSWEHVCTLPKMTLRTPRRDKITAPTFRMEVCKSHLSNEGMPLDHQRVVLQQTSIQNKDASEGSQIALFDVLNQRVPWVPYNIRSLVDNDFNVKHPMPSNTVVSEDVYSVAESGESAYSAESQGTATSVTDSLPSKTPVLSHKPDWDIMPIPNPGETGRTYDVSLMSGLSALNLDDCQLEDVAFPEHLIPSHIDFKADPAHEYWKWNEKERNWCHKDEGTGNIVWAPLDFS